MPMTYSIDLDSNLVRMHGTGRLTDEEMIACVRALRADDRLSPELNTLSDMRGIEIGFSRARIPSPFGAH